MPSCWRTSAGLDPWDTIYRTKCRRWSAAPWRHHRGLWSASWVTMVSRAASLAPVVASGSPAHSSRDSSCSSSSPRLNRRDCPQLASVCGFERIQWPQSRVARYRCDLIVLVTLGIAFSFDQDSPPRSLARNLLFFLSHYSSCPVTLSRGHVFSMFRLGQPIPRNLGVDCDCCTCSSIIYATEMINDDVNGKSLESEDNIFVQQSPTPNARQYYQNVNVGTVLSE